MDERLGATFLGDDRTAFFVWAPHAERVEVLIEPDGVVPLDPLERGYHTATADGVGPGTRYRLRLDAGRPLPDPASRFQPEGVHGPSEVVDPSAFEWSDVRWTGVPLEELVFYELHIGTFTPEGTFDAAIPLLEELRGLGITAIELMPVSQFPGERNWGYDGVLPFAVQDSYGGPDGLRRLVDAAHRTGLAVYLDVVYNHLGPEGNILPEYGPYFTEHYRTPWGDAINFDDEASDEVRRYFIEHAVSRIDEYHVDGLRLDAIHGIVDVSAQPFLAELAQAVHDAGARSGRMAHLIAESDRNDPRAVAPIDQWGLGLDAMWNDDFHHALHAFLTGERTGYYADFGRLDDVATAIREGFVLAGRYSTYRGRRHGAPAGATPGSRLVVYTQNHDQIGNRPRGRRLTRLLSFDQLKLAAGVTLLSPYLPLLFMGEEYGETAPFHYFVSHTDPELVEAVRQGRREEFSAFRWHEEPPDPQAERTLESSKLRHELKSEPEHRHLLELHRELITLRRSLPALAELDREVVETAVDGDLLILRRRPRSPDAREVLAVFNFGASEAAGPEGKEALTVVLDSADERWGGQGRQSPREIGPGERPKLAPRSFILMEAR